MTLLKLFGVYCVEKPPKARRRGFLESIDFYQVVLMRREMKNETGLMRLITAFY